MKTSTCRIAKSIGCFHNGRTICCESFIRFTRSRVIHGARKSIIRWLVNQFQYGTPFTVFVNIDLASMVNSRKYTVRIGPKISSVISFDLGSFETTTVGSTKYPSEPSTTRQHTNSTRNLGRQQWSRIHHLWLDPETWKTFQKSLYD